MKLYRRICGATKKTSVFEVQFLDGYHWVTLHTGKENCNAWYNNMGAALLEMGSTHDEPKRGLRCSYFLWRDPWPERTLSIASGMVSSLQDRVGTLED